MRHSRFANIIRRDAVTSASPIARNRVSTLSPSRQSRWFAPVGKECAHGQQHRQRAEPDTRADCTCLPDSYAVRRAAPDLAKTIGDPLWKRTMCTQICASDCGMGGSIFGEGIVSRENFTARVVRFPPRPTYALMKPLRGTRLISTDTQGALASLATLG